ncbi:MAG TPA: lysophospholipid acyltransferase family protein [Xanthobacteraceae bacterium]|nr:lysophospholipid acyltransferase family protein [Xanthobacteraceae bacterium]
MKLLRRITRTRGFKSAIGLIAAEYLRFVWKTNRVIIDPPDLYERVEPDLPLIIAMWHGQHFMMPFLKKNRPNHRSKVLISRHHDGDINAIAAERLGVGTIRGSGDHGGRFDRKGGVGAFKGMMDALNQGYNVALTADVPKVARVAGNGIIKLASFSGRPIYAAAVVTSRRIELNNWDKSAVNLPFGRIVIAADGPIRVPAHAEDDVVEHYRSLVQDRLDAITARAYAIAEGKIKP